jgi:chromosomal replication initiation ATPase DnaA
MNQLLLPLTTPPLFTFDNIIMHEGIQRAVSTVQSVYGSAERPLPYLFIHGPHGTGKTHILKAVASLLQARADKGPETVKFLSPVGDPPRFDDLEKMARANEEETCENYGLVIDDLHLVGQEDALHLWNLANKITRWGAPLVMSSLHPPEEVFSNNPHLRSRVISGLVFALEVPDDSIRALILDKMAKDRNVRLPQDVATYLVTRKSRNVKELGRLLAIVDTESLRLKRRITLSLVKSIETDGLL